VNCGLRFLPFTDSLCFNGLVSTEVRCFTLEGLYLGSNLVRSWQYKKTRRRRSELHYHADWLRIQSKNTQIVWIVPKLCKRYTRSEWASLYSSGYVLEYIVPRLCQKYTCNRKTVRQTQLLCTVGVWSVDCWAWLYGFGYVLKSIVPLFSISTRNLHVSRSLYRLEVWAVRRPMRVCCGSRWGQWEFDGPLLGVYGHVYSIRPVRSVWPVHIHTLAGAAGAWFIRTSITSRCRLSKNVVDPYVSAFKNSQLVTANEQY